MPTLKNRQSQIPNGMSFTQAAFPKWHPVAWSSFNSIVSQVMEVRRGNAHVSIKHSLATDQTTIEREVDEWNANHCLRMGWLDFINAEAPNFPKAMPPRKSFSSPLAAGGHVRKSFAGIKVYADWLGSGLKPVESALSEKRASVCANCKENQDPNWIQKFEAAIANKFKQLIEIKNDLKVATSHDAKLFSCQKCDCPLGTKVHVPIDHVLKGTDEKTMAALRAVQPMCWIVAEAKA